MLGKDGRRSQLNAAKNKQTLKIWAESHVIPIRKQKLEVSTYHIANVSFYSLPHDKPQLWFFFKEIYFFKKM